jgi:neopullulanase
VKKYLIYFIFSFIAFPVQAQIERMEPPFWWSEMQHSNLEILFYGKDIAQYNVSSPLLKIKEIKRTENPNYLFVTIETKGIKPGNYTLDFLKNNLKQFSQIYELKQRETGAALREGFDASDVIYLIMPDRFANGNPDNDNTDDTVEKVNREYPGGRHGGDIEGIIQNLNYLDDLGVTAIWTTPLLEDNEPVYSYHTYAQSDLYRVDPRFGTNEDYKRLSREMAKRGMKLIKDYVTNHWGSKHWIIQDLPAPDWIHIWEDGDETGFKRSNYRMTTQYDPYAAQIDAKGCMNGWFDNTMPDMNQRNPLLLNYIIQNAIWWIEYADLGGLRVDTYSYNDKDGIAAWTKAIMDEYPRFNIVGEVWMHNQASMAYWQKDSKVGAIQGYNSHLPSLMDFTLFNAISVMFNEEEGWDKGLQRAYDNFSNDYLYPNPDNLLVFAGNHDTNRFSENYSSNLDAYKLAMTLILTTRGIPQLYYGDEIGMLGNKYLGGDGDIRRDFPGGWPGDSQNAFTKEGRTAEQEQYHSFLKKLLQFRKKTPALHFGKLLHFLPKDQVYVYFRTTENQSVMVVLNNSSKQQTLDLKYYGEGIRNAFGGLEIIENKNISFTNPVIVLPKSPMVILLE